MAGDLISIKQGTTDFRSPAPARVPELAIIIPTFNEIENIAPLLAKIDAALPHIPWEVIFVDDDSPDGTAARIRSVARADPRVRCVQRIGRRGLSTACVEGVLATSAPYVAVMDADMQHDEALLGSMLRTLKENDLDIVIGSRYIVGGSLGEWTPVRRLISRTATRIAHWVVRADLTDPMSGFFMARREVFENAVRQLSGQGFKILVDLFASSPQPLDYLELPYTFRQREHGESKLDTRVAGEYLLLLLDKSIGRFVPTRFVLFGAVGALGVVVHLAALYLALSIELGFVVAQAAATLIAMCGNFLLNNQITYRDQRLRGFQLITGFLSFALICSVGASANVGVASFLFSRDTTWWLAGVAGALVGAVFNYAMASTFTWRLKPKQAA